MSEEEKNIERNLGTQPLDALLTSWGLTNHDVVDISPEQITHKQVQKARTGRRLTLKMMMKMTRTVNYAVWGRLSDEEREDYDEYFHKHIFNYAKGYDPEAEDINAEIFQDLSSRKVRKDFIKELNPEDPFAEMKRRR